MSRRKKQPLGPLTLGATVADHEGRIGAQAEDIDNLEGAFQGLGGQMTKILDWLEARPGGPWSWRTLDQDAAKELWAELYDWVNWLRDRYLVHLSGDDTYRLLNDWYKHPVAVEMLTALMVSHQYVYRRTRAAPSFDLVEWHERCLWPTFQRMRALNLFPTSHATDAPWTPADPLPRTPDDDNFAEFVLDDLRSRPEGEHVTEPVRADGPPALTDADAPPTEEDWAE
ncbi:hypothetical protein [Leifsonia sp. TF02-11]|uniref:hypothetical protein n=1 Tax=Leifsonia sp. TF02-11 TaxID=2815212 RepID=UPI001AA12CE5|nr:hypothetical protein [Leifsonia sp. TF02-11]MBO1741022.1 hypothetical protein [Leifsonia sp. TF02-11]